jgi:hypothetical protein
MSSFPQAFSHLRHWLEFAGVEPHKVTVTFMFPDDHSRERAVAKSFPDGTPNNQIVARMFDIPVKFVVDKSNDDAYTGYMKPFPSLPNDHGSCGYHVSGNHLVRNDTREIVATYQTHSDAVQAMMAIPPFPIRRG